jgi:hypothetical protein
MSIDVDALRPRLTAALGEEFQLGELLGAGGFAAVFRAHDPFLQRDVAIKVLDPELAIGGDLEEQFLHEARVIAGTEHPHIVPLYGAESRGGLLYLVMRLLPGQSLADRIAAGPVPPPEAARLALEVARALSAAHAGGVVHRDIKPDNILLDANGHAAVSDFGISVVQARAPGDQPGMTAGTPHYMSPEQAMGEAVDGRSDVYALGVVLFEMLTGQRPFEGRNVTEIIAKHISAAPPRVSSLAPATPAALVRLVDRLLAKEQVTRPDAAELVTLLAAATTPDALLSPGRVRLRRWRRRSVYVGIAAGSAGLVIWFIVRMASGYLGLFTEGGADPVLLAAGDAVPDSIVAMARTEGSLFPGERVTFAFIPSGRTAADASLFADSILVRRSPAGARRYFIRGGKVDVSRTRDRGDSAVQGYFIVTPMGAEPETLYRDLSSTESVRLVTELAAWSRALKQRAEAGKARVP